MFDLFILSLSINMLVTTVEVIFLPRYIVAQSGYLSVEMKFIYPQPIEAIFSEHI